MHRIVVVLAVAVSLPPGVGAAASARVPLEKVVASLVRDLGADPYDVRERATATLRQVGEPARGVLERAAGSDDPEIRVRARDILGDLRSGIRPHWSASTVLLMRHFDRRQQHEKYQALQQIVASLGHEAVPFLIQKMTDADNNVANWAFRMVQQMNDVRAWKQVLGLVHNPANDVQARALAWARGQSGQATEAIERLAREQIHKVQPDPAVEKALGAIAAHLDAGRATEALAAAKQFAARAPGDARGRYLQADALIALDQDKEALALRKRALELNPEKEEPHFLAGQLLRRRGHRRLAAREWERILDIQPNDGICDIHAWLSLSLAHADSGLFEQAAQYLEKAHERYAKLKADDNDAVVGGTIESLQMEVTRLRQLAARYTAPNNTALTDPIAPSEVQVALRVEVTDGTVAELAQALAGVAGQIRLSVEPGGLDLFEATSAALRYDGAKKQLVVLLGEEPACEPFPLDAAREGEAPAERFRVAAHVADRTHIFRIDAASGEAKPIAKYTKDYFLTVKPGTRLGTFTDVALRVNGAAHKWGNAVDRGVKLDRLPGRLDLVVQGTAPSGARLTVRFDLPEPEPVLEAAKP